jgi:hypothetical protein
MRRDFPLFAFLPLEERDVHGAETIGTKLDSSGLVCRDTSPENYHEGIFDILNSLLVDRDSSHAVEHVLHEINVTIARHFGTLP